MSSGSIGTDVAITEWQQSIGIDKVVQDRSDLEVKERCTFDFHTGIIAILQPATVDDVCAIMRIASLTKTPIFPISRGLNWGYGSSQPPVTGCALIDLSALDGIRDFNERYGYVTIEPGVTFSRLRQFLEAQDSKWTISATGGPQDGSLIGNALERGIGSSSTGENASMVVSLEAVMPGGEVLRTGFPRFGGDVVAPNGIGMDLTPLFFQSNFGVVTAMTFYLSRRPAMSQMCIFEIGAESSLELLLDTVQELKAESVVTGPVKVLNFRRVLDYLILDAGKKPPTIVGEDTAKLAARALGIGAWMGLIPLHGLTSPHAAELRHLVQDKLQIAGATVAFSGSSFSSPDLARLQATRPWFAIATTEAENSSGLFMMYREKQTAIPSDLDPDRDQCGLIWIPFVFALDGRSISDATDGVERICVESGFSVDIAITCLSARYALVLVAIVFDQEIPKRNEQAWLCQQAIMKTLAACGGSPYRLDIRTMRTFSWPADEYERVQAQVKRATDPHLVIAPGRYERAADY